MLAIEARGLRRTFRPPWRLMRSRPERVAVDRIDLAVEQGTIFGLLGRNGAGKTTTIKMLSTLLIPTAGEARVAGYDVTRQERAVRRSLGVVLGGDRGLYGKLSARANLVYFAHLYGLPRHTVGRRVDAMLALVELSDRAADRVEGFSRGMKQRLHLARALLHDPPVVVLDEPTIGLDPASAVNLRRVVASLIPEHTVLLTTHYLHEADELCDRIAIIDRGRILVEDTPEGIKRRAGGDTRYEIVVRGECPDLAASLRAQPTVAWVDVTAEPGGTRTYTLSRNDRSASVDGVIRLAQRRGARIEGARRLTSTLEDAFLALTDGVGGASA